jgi:hypothetical protein
MAAKNEFNPTLSCGKGCGIGCLGIILLFIFFTVLDSIVQYYESANIGEKIGLVLLFLFIIVLIGIAVYYNFNQQYQKREEYNYLENQIISALQEFQSNPDNNELRKEILANAAKLETLAREINLELHVNNHAKYQILQELNEIEYQATLKKLQLMPDNLTLRNKVSELGKWLALNYSEKYSEQSLTNDLLVAISNRGNGGQATSVAQEIQKLGLLHSKGFITAEEFERGKALFLGNPPDKARKLLEILATLYRMKKQGALSESEYNTKKWDLLSGKLIKP